MEKKIKPCWVVLNVSKSQFDEKAGIRFGATGLPNGNSYQMQVFESKAEASSMAARCAQGGNVGCVFELTEALLTQPPPIVMLIA